MRPTKGQATGRRPGVAAIDRPHGPRNERRPCIRSAVVSPSRLASSIVHDAAASLRRPQLGAILVVSVLGACASPGAPVVSGAWVRAPMGADAPAAAYFVITNGTGQDDALTAVSSPAASSAQIHKTESDMGGMTGMTPVARVDVKAGSTLTFAPGGFHVMLMGLHGSMNVGDRIELDLTFEHAGRVVVQAEVRQG